MARKINEEGLELIKRWEGLNLKAYTDISGTLTIGYGHTNRSGNLPKVYADMVITKSEAETILRRDLRVCEYNVEKLVKVPLNDPQFATLVSFCYNVGVNNLKKSILLQRLNLGQYEHVPTELMKWNKSGGKIITGLTNRRAAESGLWVKGSYVSSSYQKTDSKVVDRGLYTEIAMPVVGTVSGLSGIASESKPLQYAFAFVMITAALVGAYFVYKKIKESRL